MPSTKSILFLLSWAVFASSARADQTVKVLMQQKLDAAHRILDAIAVQDYGKIEAQAGQLRRIGRITTWHKVDDEDFLLFAKSFENSAAFLEERAKEKDGEGVAMGYIRLTLDCLRCHDVVRTKAKR